MVLTNSCWFFCFGLLFSSLSMTPACPSAATYRVCVWKHHPRGDSADSLSEQAFPSTRGLILGFLIPCPSLFCAQGLCLGDTSGCCLTGCNAIVLAGAKVFEEETCVPPSGYQIIKTTVPHKLSFSRNRQMKDGKSGGPVLGRGGVWLPEF